MTLSVIEWFFGALRRYYVIIMIIISHDASRFTNKKITNWMKLVKTNK